MSYAALLRKHLMSIYMRLDKIEKGLTDYGDQLSKQAKKLAKEKLTAAEFHKFMDKFVEALTENLPSPSLEAESIEGENAPPDPPLTEEITTPSSQGSKGKD